MRGGGDGYADGPEPCAVLACRGSGDCALHGDRARQCQAAGVPAHYAMGAVAGAGFAADFDRQSEAQAGGGVARAHPDRGSDGRAAARRQANGDHAFGPSSDWLLALIAQITGEALCRRRRRAAPDRGLASRQPGPRATGRGDRGAAGNRFEATSLLEEVQTLGELRKVVAGGGIGSTGRRGSERASERGSRKTRRESRGKRSESRGRWNDRAEAAAEVRQADRPRATPDELKRPRFIYPEWPWWKPFQWIRAAFVEAVLRPGTWLLVKPRVVGPRKPLPKGPLLIVANHVTSYDGDLIVYALPGPYRRRMAAAMLGEMLDDFLHWRNPWKLGDKGFYIFGPAAYYLVTALFNVFPLPHQRDFQRSFAHAGKALDHGYNVLVFPEGTLSPDGQMAKFRSGIGLLAKQSFVPVLAGGHAGTGRVEDAPAPLVPVGNPRNSRWRSHFIRSRRDRGGDHRAPAGCGGAAAG